MHDYQNVTTDFSPGMRVGLHPSLDLWARGARTGTVARITSTRVWVVVDRYSNRAVAFYPARIRPLTNPDTGETIMDSAYRPTC